MRTALRPIAPVKWGFTPFWSAPGAWKALPCCADGSSHKDRGEIHAGFVLAGRAIQDVWIFPTAFHGSTLRIYDPGLDAWHILWSDPLKQYYTRQIGRAAGNDIVQEGRAENGDIIRWRFIERTNDKFRWLGERSDPSGNNFKLQAEFFARRVT